MRNIYMKTQSAWNFEGLFIPVYTGENKTGNKIKRYFFESVVVSVLRYDCNHQTNETLKEKARWKLYKSTGCCFE